MIIPVIIMMVVVMIVTMIGTDEEAAPAADADGCDHEKQHPPFGSFFDLHTTSKRDICHRIRNGTQSARH